MCSGLDETEREPRDTLTKARRYQTVALRGHSRRSSLSDSRIALAARRVHVGAATAPHGRVDELQRETHIVFVVERGVNRSQGGFQSILISGVIVVAPSFRLHHRCTTGGGFERKSVDYVTICLAPRTGLEPVTCPLGVF